MQLASSSLADRRPAHELVRERDSAMQFGLTSRYTPRALEWSQLIFVYNFVKEQRILSPF